MKRLLSLAAVLATCIVPAINLPPVIAQSATGYENNGDNTTNHNPDPAACCSCVAMSVVGVVDQPESGLKRLKPDEKGNYRAQVVPSFSNDAPPGTVCDDEYTLTVTANLRAQSGVVHSEQKSITMTRGGPDVVLEFNLSAEIARSGNEWDFALTCGGGENEGVTRQPGEKLETKKGCSTITVILGGCDSCQSGSCDPSTSSGSFTVSIPTTVSLGGMTEGTLDFYAPSFSNPGRRALLANLPVGFTVNRAADGSVSSVSTGACTIEVLPADPVVLALDPNAFSVIHKDLAGTVFRTTTISLVTEAGSARFRMDSVFENATTRHEQTQPQPGTFVLEKGRLVSGSFQPLWQETFVRNETAPGIRLQRRTIRERAAAASPWSVTSDVRHTWENQSKGWVMTREVIDPDGEQLTSTWSYYQPGDITGPGGATDGVGQVKHHVRHDGFESFHTYELNQTTVTSPFAGNPAGRLETHTWDPVTRTETSTTSVNGMVIAKSSVSHAGTTETRNVHTEAGQTLQTVTSYMPSNADFGGRPARVIHPDGTLTSHAYTRNPGGGYTTITDTGSTTDSTTVAKGTRITTTVNARGTTILSQTTAIGHGTGSAVFDSMAVTSVDTLGRALITAHHPASATVTGEVASATGAAWITSTEYSCCGVSMETDMYGIPTRHAYDHLQRRIKTNRLGVTTETVRNGLTTETHRYPENVAATLSPAFQGTSATLVAKSVTNLAGTLQESWSPDPTSAAPGALVKDSSTATTYKPAAGLSTRTITTVPGGHSQTTDSFLDGRTATTSGDLSPAMTYSYSVNPTGETSSQSYLDGANLRETTTTQTDWAGRTKRVTYMDNSFTQMVYNDLGQMEKSTDPDGVATLFAYNPEGERTVTAIDLDRDDAIDYGSDTVSFSETKPVLEDSNPVFVTTNKVWHSNDANQLVESTVSTSKRSPSGLSGSVLSIGLANPATTETVITKDANGFGTGAWTTTSTAPDGTYSVTTHTAGLMDTSENFDSNDNLISSTSMRDAGNSPLSGYDALKRPTHQRDSRTGVTTTAYLSTTADVVASVTDPGNRTTAFTYDVRGRRTHVDAPDSLDASGATLANITQTLYFPDGNVQETTGGQTYRTTHSYDYADRQETLTTYGSTTATTTWIHSPTRGFLVEKNYAGESNNGPGNNADYTYTAAGRLRTRTWERGVVTTYYYDTGGRQRAIDYSDATPDVLYSFDALGRITNQAQGTLAVTNGIPSMASPIRSVSNTYDPATLRLESETHNLGGITRTLVRSYESAGRPDEVAVGINTDSNPATLETTDHYTGYLYGNDGRLLGIDAKDLPRFSGKDYGIEYGYTDDSASLIHTLTRAGSLANLITTHTWDSTRDALLVTDNRLDGAPNPVSQYAYTVNSLGQRDKVETVGTAFGVAPVWNWAYNPRGELVSAKDTSANNRSLGYIYDGIGNRLATGDVYSVSAGVEQVTNPVAYTPNSLNQYTAAKGVTLPTTPAPAPYDLDGNLRFDGGVNKDNEAREYVWDAENRLIAVKRTSDGTALVTYAYDSQSRRISRSAGVSSVTIWYLYDGWNVVAEYTGSTPALSRTQTWGVDLSGSLQGAGGVGGLLAVNLGGTSYYTTFDGNGNVSEYLTTAGVVAAHFEYDPFGNLTGFTEQSQGLAASFPHSFSTKPVDDITGWFYYGYRYYDPVTGRWLSRDPIEERGGVNLYEFVKNHGVNKWDILGLSESGEQNAKQEVIKKFAFIAGPEADPFEELDVRGSALGTPWDQIRYALGDPLSQNDYFKRIRIHNPTQILSKSQIETILDDSKGEWNRENSPKKCCVRFQGALFQGKADAPLTPWKLQNLLVDLLGAGADKSKKADKVVLAAHTEWNKQGIQGLFLGVGSFPSKHGGLPVSWGAAYDLGKIFDKFPAGGDPLEIYTCMNAGIPRNVGGLTINVTGESDDISEWNLIKEKSMPRQQNLCEQGGSGRSPRL